MEYVNLHTHTEFSNATAGLDSMNRLDSLVSYSQSIGLTGLAITEHDQLGGSVRINRKQKELQKAGNSFKLIHGNEIYLVEEFEDNDKKDTKRRYYHFVLIAKDRLGFQALMDISSKAWLRSAIQRGRRRVPTLYSDIEEVFDKLKCQGHIIASTACIGGFLPQSLLKEDYDAANKFIKWGQQVFGKDDFFIEYQSSKIPDQLKFNSRASIAYPNIPKIITTDAHYLKKDQFDVFEAFMRSQQETREVKEYYDDAYIQSSEEIFENLHGNLSEGEIKEALENTKRIAEQVEFYDLEEKPRIPIMPIPTISKVTWELTGYSGIDRMILSNNDVEKYLIQQCLNKLQERNLWNQEYLKRLNEEIVDSYLVSEKINDNLFTYFTSVKFLQDTAWSIGCAVGPGRGSAGGSLILYLLDVTQLDPIRYNLYWWRFVSPERPELADIDEDYDAVYRHSFIEKLREILGYTNVAQVATYRKMTLKAAITSACRGYKTSKFPQGIDSDIALYLSSLVQVERGAVATLKQSYQGDDELGFKKNVNLIKEIKNYSGLYEIIKEVEGLIVGSGSHAAALVFGNQENPIMSHSAIHRSPNGDLITALDLHDAEYVSLVKYDVLQTTTLSRLTATLHLLQQDGVIDPNLTLKEAYDKFLHPDSIDFNNQEIWQHLNSGDVLGVFQFEGAQGNKILKQLKPSTINEMTTANAIMRLRPAAGQEHPADRFVRMKESNLQDQEVEFREMAFPKEIEDKIRAELKPFNYVCSAQETLMLCCMNIMGYSMAEANRIRKVLAKKKMDQITIEREFFRSKGELIKLNDKQINYLWKVFIEPQLSYSFCLAHGSLYSVVGVQTIWTNILFHPIYWKTACLLQQSGSLDGKSADYNKIAKAVGSLKDSVNILPISINQSNREFTLNRDKNEIYFGLDAIKGFGEKVKNAILEERKNGLFESFEDFIDRAKPDVTSVISIFLSGGFSDFDLTNEDLKQKIFNAYGKPKEKVNGQNLLQISRLGLWPAEDDENRRIFNCLQHLKKLTPKDIQEMDYWITDDKSAEFLIERGYAPDEDGAIEKELVEDLFESSKDWIKQYISENTEVLVEQINNKLYEDFSNKYFSSMPSVGEIETMGICFADHPLKNAVGFKIDGEHGVRLKRFEDLSEEPKVAHEFIKDGRTIPMYKLDAICGCVIAKDKFHHSFTLLTKDMECVEVALRKEVFAHYDAQISIKLADGHKKVIEKSWLNRGSQVIVHGMRDGDVFRGKKYKNSKMQHELYKILDLSSLGEITYQKERKTGIKEEPEEN